jgi:hypothetical protein
VRVHRSPAVLPAALVLALSPPLVGCDPFAAPSDGWITEVETGRNGVKLEVVDGDGDYEVYLAPDTVCRAETYVHDCADVDDYLVPVDGRQPGINDGRGDR